MLAFLLVLGYACGDSGLSEAWMALAVVLSCAGARCGAVLARRGGYRLDGLTGYLGTCGCQRKLYSGCTSVVVEVCQWWRLGAPFPC